MSYQETFVAGDAGAGAYRCALPITATQLELLAGGPPGSALPAVAGAVSTLKKVATTATVAAGVTAAAAAASPAHWFDTLVGQLNAGPDVRKTVQKWLASGVSEDKLKAAMQRPDFQQTSIRLAVADKGLYQQHVILDDYAAIPGVSQQPYVPNGLPKLPIAASDFGINDADLDLLVDKATTFTGSAQLVKLNPGEKLYRVANDPTTDPCGRLLDAHPAHGPGRGGGRHSRHARVEQLPASLQVHRARPRPRRARLPCLGRPRRRPARLGLLPRKEDQRLLPGRR